MSLDHDQLHHFAHSLMDAGHSLQPITPFTDEAPGLSFEDAYEIAEDIMGHEVEHGHKIVGMKVGVTTAGAQKAFGMDGPAYGIILDDMTVRDGGRVKMSSLIQPKIEAEIAFRLKAPLQGPSVDVAQVLAATDYVFPALEIIDSRFEGWRVKPQDLIADNTASALVVLGNIHLPPSAFDLAAEEAVMEIDGTETGRGKGAEVLGHPAEAVAWLANKLGEKGRGIAAGQFVIPGSVVAPPFVKAGNTVTATYTNLGTISVKFT
ncbi:MAG: fumarylacetoacetate hydrolase family protein [Chloroflexi bacterium]|nr:fumarylacetoacetate hydrolase family protein [Chloroflexota bacterium]